MKDVELVIKIPEIEYEHLINKEKFNSLEKSKQEWLINKTLNRVIDSTPLPKGHGRIVDISKLEYLKALNDAIHNKITWSEAITKIKNSAQTIIEADNE